MRRFHILSAALLLLGVCEAYWAVQLRLPIEARQGASRRLAARSPIPSAFVKLPVDASVDVYAERIHALGHDLPHGEQVALISWMTSRRPQRFSDSNWHFLVNEVMDNLCHQRHPEMNWTDVLIGISRNPSTDPVLRDFAIQHLVDWIQPVGVGEPYETNPKKRSEIISAMLSAAGEGQESFSGTAVRGLHLIIVGRRRSERDQEESAKLSLPLTIQQLRPIAIHLATAEGVAESARIAALQVCAQCRFSEVLPEVRKWTEDANLSTALRLAAIGSLGLLGGPDDVPLLKRMQEERTGRFLNAIETAIENASHRGAADQSNG